MADGLIFPRNAGQLRRWLEDTDEGREIVRDMTVSFLEESCRKCQRLQPYPKVLIVVKRLGRHPGVEVFYETGVAVRLEEAIESQDNPSAELIADEELGARLPRSWKHLMYVPAGRIDSMVFGGLTSAQRTQADLDICVLRVLHELRALAEEDMEEEEQNHIQLACVCLQKTPTREK